MLEREREREKEEGGTEKKGKKEKEGKRGRERYECETYLFDIRILLLGDTVLYTYSQEICMCKGDIKDKRSHYIVPSLWQGSLLLCWHLHCTGVITLLLILSRLYPRTAPLLLCSG